VPAEQAEKAASVYYAAGDQQRLTISGFLAAAPYTSAMQTLSSETARTKPISPAIRFVKVLNVSAPSSFKKTDILCTHFRTKYQEEHHPRVHT
jgi:hypothetical protein